jgi:hypothetical protein
MLGLGPHMLARRASLAGAEAGRRRGAGGGSVGVPARSIAVRSHWSHVAPLHSVRRALRLHTALLPGPWQRGAKAAATMLACAAK